MPESYRELVERLDVPYSFSVSQPTPLNVVLRELTTLTGMSFRLEDKARVAATNPVALRPLENVPLRGVLDLLAKQHGLSVQVTLQGVIFTGRPEDYPEPAAAVRRKMSPESVEDMNVVKELRRVMVRDLTFDRTPLTAIVRTVKQICEIDIRLEPEVDGKAQFSGTFNSVSAAS